MLWPSFSLTGAVAIPDFKAPPAFVRTPGFAMRAEQQLMYTEPVAFQSMSWPISSLTGAVAIADCQAPIASFETAGLTTAADERVLVPVASDKSAGRS